MYIKVPKNKIQQVLELQNLANIWKKLPGGKNVMNLYHF